MTLPLLPGASEPRECLCGKPVPKGPLVHGWGSSCARQRGLTTAPEPRSAGQDGPDLFDALDEVCDTDGHAPHVSDDQAECTERHREGGSVGETEATAAAQVSRIPGLTSAHPHRTSEIIPICEDGNVP